MKLFVIFSYFTNKSLPTRRDNALSRGIFSFASVYAVEVLAGIAMSDRGWETKSLLKTSIA